jgi:2-dehydro-3-deoxygluconokinase
MIKVVTFGEIMLRLSPPGFERILQSPAFVAGFGGAEANVAVNLAGFGLDSWYVTRVPAHAIGDAAVKALRAEGVRTEAIIRGGDRLGVYYTETSAGQRSPVVIYDRANSAASQMTPEDVDWRVVFAGAAWFHVTGITPALGPVPARITGDAIRAARDAGARVSIDLNFRRKLWTEAEATNAMHPLVRDVDLLIANDEHLRAMLGIAVSGARTADGGANLEAYRSAADQTGREFGVKSVAFTLRESVSASENGWSALLWDRASNEMHCSQRYDLRLVDRIGGGDAFAAGLIYGLVTGRAPADALRFAVAAGALNQTIPGDFSRVSVDEVDRLAGGDASGRLER